MKAAIVAVCLVLLSAWPASARTKTPTPTRTATPTATSTATPTATPTPKTSAVTNQGVSAPGQPCATSTVMQAGTWYLVSASIVCQPCLDVTGGAQLPSYCPTPAAPTKGICDAAAPIWGETVHGHVAFGPPSEGTAATAVRVQTYIGESHDETLPPCNAGDGQVNCSDYGFAWDAIWDVPSSTNSVQVPFDIAAEGGAYWSTPGDGNPTRFYVFAMPIGGSLMCTSNQFVTEESNAEYF